MKLLTVFLCSLLAIVATAQDTMEKTMERRAREMFKAIAQNNPDVWKQFIKDNYTKALIDKPMRAQVEGGASGASSSTTTTHEGNIEGKARMYQRLHDDFGGGKITALKTAGDQVEMAVTNGGMTGTFTLKFNKEKPYLIDGLGIEVGN